MKLYLSPGACSLAPHILLRELGIGFEPVLVDLATKRTGDGRDFRTVNPLGYVPALELEDGQVLTEVLAILLFLAERHPQAEMVPPPGSVERARLYGWLSFVATELHKLVGALFAPNVTEATRVAVIERARPRLAHVDRALEGRDYLIGERFGPADAYLFTVSRWLGYLKIDTADFPNLRAHQERVRARPAVSEALRVETELKKAAG
ncbi:MAG: glutathione transferase GstA [Myxococcota bacterium]|nr:glutathione transferase GstA [Myxococcota bacterium]MDW8362595.1 glutathione transferase GstA [Myxococcales bacterium]